jgi:drug/metabolite transporter (DMT)-like permease
MGSTSDENQKLLQPAHQHAARYSSDQGEGSAAENQVQPEPEVPWYKVVFGILLVVAAGCSFTAANVVQKIICPSLNFWSLLLIRSITQMVVMAGHLTITRTNFLGPKESKNKIFLQGVFGGMLLLAIFVAVKHVPLGNASAIFFCTPVSYFINFIPKKFEFLISKF